MRQEKRQQRAKMYAKQNKSKIRTKKRYDAKEMLKVAATMAAGVMGRMFNPFNSPPRKPDRYFRSKQEVERLKHRAALKREQILNRNFVVEILKYPRNYNGV